VPRGALTKAGTINHCIGSGGSPPGRLGNQLVADVGVAGVLERLVDTPRC
jgi:hypothetical protein